MGKRQNLDYQNLGIFDMISEVSILSSDICPLFSDICLLSSVLCHLYKGCKQ